MNEIKIYQKLEFGKIRTTTNKDGVPLFCLKDICNILDIGNASDVKNRLIDPHLEAIVVRVQTGIKRDGTPALQTIPMNFVSEVGLYQAVFVSRKPNARMFTEWITKELLPTIRKTDSQLTEDTWERIIKNPGDLGRLLIEYQNIIDKIKKVTNK